jgi:hypothetical protein
MILQTSLNSTNTMNRYTSLLFVAVVALLAGCMHRDTPFRVVPSAATLIDTVPGTAPCLAKDGKGGVVLSWIRSTGDSTNVFCYARSADGGRSFGAPVVVAPSTNIKPHSENLPKVVFKPSGEIIALWGTSSRDARNKYAGNVCYAQSFDEGRTWTAATPLVRDTAGYDQRYFDVALLPGGEAAIVWLDNRKVTDKEGSSLFYAATAGRSGFAGERRVAQQCCPCCRTDLFVDSKGGIHVLYRGILKDSIRDMVHSASLDGGRTFTTPQQVSPDNWVIDGCPHTGPAMTENKEGLHFAWYTGGAKKGSFYTSSVNNGQSFAPSDSISPLGKHPQLAALEGGDLVIVWDEPVAQGGQFHTRIGLQKRGSGGRSEGKALLTGEGQSDSYPVLTATGEETVLVAFCREQKGNKYVAWQRVSFH